MVNTVITQADGSRWGMVFTAVCVFVCFFLYDISKTDAAMITKLDREMFHHKSWKLIYFVIKKVTGQGHEAQNIAGVGLCTLMSAGFF